MARIRSIHPNILTDPEFALIPRDGRLLFIYSWPIADDAGNLERSPLGLKMACFPGDNDLPAEKIAELTDLLIDGRFYEPFEDGGKQYLHIRTFKKYQKPDHPTAPRYPLCPGQEYTYHFRQGNTYVPKTEKGPLSEREGNVLTGEELELERKGKELDLEGDGKEGRGPGREGKQDARPLAFGGQAAASSIKTSSNCNGTPKASEKERRGEAAISSPPGLLEGGAGGDGSTIKKAALYEVIRLIKIGEIDLAGASDKLRNFGFTHPEINDPALFKLLQQAIPT